MKIRTTLILSALPVVLIGSAAAAQTAQPAQSAQPAQPAQSAQPAQPAQAAQPAQQTGQAGITAGARIKDTQGGDVGTVTRVDGNFVVLRTDKHEARLPVASFTPHEGALLIAMTREQLNAEVEKTLAQAETALVAGATVTGSQGSTVGTIDTIDDQFVTLKLSSGTMVRLPRSGIAPGPNGVVIGMTAAQLEAAAAGASQ